MKNLILLATVFLSLNVFAAEKNLPINEKVLKTFNQVFKDAQNVTWNSTDKYAEATFKSGDVKTKAFLDNDGKLVQTIRYYQQENLPSNILYNIQKKYSHKIWGVTEVSNSTGTVYNVVLKSSKHWYTVKANSDGEVLLVSRLKRGDI